MTQLLDLPPYGPRDDSLLLEALNQLTRHHLEGCPEYRRIWPDWTGAQMTSDFPWLHVGLFKHIAFRTDFKDAHFERVLKSSATTGGLPSLISLDRKSSELQSRSTSSILENFLGDEKRPLLILDSAKSLRTRGELSARIAAALSLKPLASEIHFLLEDPDDAQSMRWDVLEAAIDRFDDLLVYGFTWILWLAWGGASVPHSVRSKLAGKRINFVHSGGWKKLEEIKVERKEFDQALLFELGSNSRVIDFYGLVEQVGIIYPLCEFGFRHVPVSADVIVRDPYNLESVIGRPGQLQLMNILAHGAPYHSVLTEDLGIIEPGPCPCGRTGSRFQLLGRIPKAEIRGCANV